MSDLPGISLICADTTRSRAYLQALARHGLRPAHVLAMRRPGGDLPGQSRAPLPAAPARPDPLWQAAAFDPNSALEDDLRVLGAPVTTIDSADINAPDTVAAIAALPGDTAIFSGYGGQILRRDALGAGKAMLHVHGGWLPAFRGSTTNWFSLLAEGTLGASAIFLTAEIDAGPILLRRRFPAPFDRTVIDHLHDGAARAAVLVETLSAYLERGAWPRVDPAPGERAETFYVAHPVLKHLAAYGPSDVFAE
ncbi:hypothetical protein E2L08_10295 [Palleronia sediminis]|uniref:Formyl transferase N-terminal domain-containing protein n=1 Tax=Palleronia sediminis TaxID=2547833 RepID=A0A4R6ADX4_9RHOB|nr:formyltransferase family protein [Palleronia sediminis]TDL79403.1 hypothetical protein E2L08_10295 [Palleronia sediminis]